VQDYTRFELKVRYDCNSLLGEQAGKRILRLRRDSLCISVSRIVCQRKTCGGIARRGGALYLEVPCAAAPLSPFAPLVSLEVMVADGGWSVGGEKRTSAVLGYA
jgi:hypothetical protein